MVLLTKEAGAHVVLDYTTPTTELISNILHANNGKLVDKIVEVEFGSNLEMNTAVIQVRGHIVTYGSSLNSEFGFAKVIQQFGTPLRPF